MIRKLKYIVFVFCIACSKTPADQPKSTVLTAVLRSNHSENKVEYGLLDENLPGQLTLIDAEMTIMRKGQQSVNLNIVDGAYRIEDNYSLVPDSVYEINVKDSENQLSASATVRFPPEISLLSEAIDTIHFNAPGSVAGLLDWNSLDEDKYSFVFRLENLETDLSPLPNGGGLFEDRYNGPQLLSQLLLLKSDFGYYGRHRLSVFAIDRELEGVFFYDPSDLRGLLRNGPSNVNGASGFVAGITGFEIELIVAD